MTKHFLISLVICLIVTVIVDTFFPKGKPITILIAFGVFWLGSFWVESYAEKNMSPLTPSILVPWKELPRFVEIGDCYEVLYSFSPDGDRTFINVLRDISPGGDTSKIFVTETNNGYGLPKKFQIRLERSDEHGYHYVFAPIP